MTVGLVPREEFALYINTGTVLSPTWVLFGDGVETAAINMNPQSKSKTYIHQSSGTTNIESYQPAMPFEAEYVAGDDALDYLEGLWRSRAVLAASQTEVCLVFLYETPTGDVYPAQKQSCAVQFDNYGGAGGESLKLSGAINFIGDPTAGSFDVGTPAFTPS